MQGSARKDVVFGAARVYTVTVPGPKWKSWLKRMCCNFGGRRSYGRSRRDRGPVRLSSHGLFSQNRRMGTPFTPSRKDVERYRRLRALSMDLNHRIIKTIPRRAYDEVGDAIGILSNGVLEFESADMTSVLMDCCLYDWFQSGKSVVQQYSETHPALPGTDEQHLLSAYVQAKYRVLVVQSAVAGAGLRCQDVLNNEDLFLMDLGLSQSAKGANAALATRTIPLGEYWMTTGAGLPINSKKPALDALGRIASGKQKSFEGPGSEALLIVRACLAAGAAGYVTYASAEAKPREPRRRRWRWS